MYSINICDDNNNDICTCFFIRSLDTFSQQENILPVLRDLIIYFQASPQRMDHEMKQKSSILIRNRQNMFQQEVNIQFVYV